MESLPVSATRVLPTDTIPVRVGGALVSALAALGLLAAVGCQMPDPYFQPRLEAPAYSVPTVGIDTTHHNFHQAEGRYRPFADLLTADGYRVRNFNTAFGPDCLVDPPNCEHRNALEQIDILVIANARNEISQEEADAIALWVSEGGSLLLAMDHAPYDSPPANLLANLGITTQPEGPGAVFTRADGSLNGSHPIANGGTPSEIVNEVETSCGTGLGEISPAPSFVSLTPILSFAPDNFQSIAVTYAAGRAYVSGEAGGLTSQMKLAMFDSAQAVFDLCMLDPTVDSSRDCLIRAAESQCAQLGVGPDQCVDWMITQGIRFGLTARDNQQFLLNIVHWLDGLL